MAIKCRNTHQIVAIEVGDIGQQWADFSKLFLKTILKKLFSKYYFIFYFKNILQKYFENNFENYFIFYFQNSFENYFANHCSLQRLSFFICGSVMCKGLKQDNRTYS